MTTDLARAALPFTLTATGLVPVGVPTLSDYARALAEFLRIEGAIQWWLGDLLQAGFRQHGEAFAQLLDERAAQTLQNYRWVAGQYLPAERHPALSFSHHADAAALEAGARQAVLVAAEREQWTRARLRDEVRAIKAQQQDAAGEALVDDPVYAVRVARATGRCSVWALNAAAWARVPRGTVEVVELGQWAGLVGGGE